MEVGDPIAGHVMRWRIYHHVMLIKDLNCIELVYIGLCYLPVLSSWIKPSKPYVRAE